VAIAYLTLVELQPLDDAWALVRAARPVALPDWLAYRACRSDLIERHRDRIEHRARELRQQKDPEESFDQACAEVIREVLSDPDQGYKVNP
jgi:hypothetical protein